MKDKWANPIVRPRAPSTQLKGIVATWIFVIRLSRRASPSVPTFNSAQGDRSDLMFSVRWPLKILSGQIKYWETRNRYFSRSLPLWRFHAGPRLYPNGKVKLGNWNHDGEKHGLEWGRRRRNLFQFIRLDGTTDFKKMRGVLHIMRDVLRIIGHTNLSVWPARTRSLSDSAEPLRDVEIPQYSSAYGGDICP